MYSAKHKAALGVEDTHASVQQVRALDDSGDEFAVFLALLRGELCDVHVGHGITKKAVALVIDEAFFKGVEVPQAIVPVAYGGELELALQAEAIEDADF